MAKCGLLGDSFHVFLCELRVSHLEAFHCSLSADLMASAMLFPINIPKNYEYLHISFRGFTKHAGKCSFY
jgi:hypothetical protein